MKKSNTLWRSSHLVGLILLASINLYGQDLTLAWQNYSHNNAMITQLLSERQLHLTEQENLKNRVKQLRGNSFWYNAWYNKLLLATYSKNQLKLSETITALDQRLTQLTATQKKHRSALKIAYEEVLESYMVAGSVPVDKQETTLEVGQWFVNQPPGTIQLPDYTELFTDNYSSPELRKLVLGDVQILLKDKIMEMDSLLHQAMEEQELARRLAEFHADLGLQIEAGQDIQPRDESGNPLQTSAWGSSMESSNSYSEFILDQNEIPSLSPSTRTSETTQLSPGNISHGNPPDIEHPNTNVAYLKSKKNEYDVLLKRIENELNSTP